MFLFVLQASTGHFPTVLFVAVCDDRDRENLHSGYKSDFFDGWDVWMDGKHRMDGMDGRIGCMDG